MVGSTIGPSCLPLSSLFLPYLSTQVGQMVGSTIGPSCLANLLPDSAFSALPSGPDGWFNHRSVLSYTLLPVSAFSPSQACQMVGSTHRSVLSSSLIPVSAFSPPKCARWLVLP
ncbi:hypothetical protein DPMN_005247 [Dreissena polymorpha]|uniref:Uncharacterized protein n=1 Tax=Dreissena polymorpha TaxID=45954 RepID=A0A9D4MU78_DREPO|nr:hypothetical protein DPMN_005247 [Dreissena polymorpha]